MKQKVVSIGDINVANDLPFVLFGGLLALKWRPVMWLHLPAAAWGVAVEVFHLPCPLTRWENLLRHLAGQDGYGGGFVEHYILTLIYPAGLTPNIQWVLAAVVLLISIAVYVRLLRQKQAHNPVRPM